MKCCRCNGKGWTLQAFFGNEDDLRWDLCDICDGTGVEPDPPEYIDDDWEFEEQKESEA